MGCCSKTVIFLLFLHFYQRHQVQFLFTPTYASLKFTQLLFFKQLINYRKKKFYQNFLIEFSNIVSTISTENAERVFANVI